jgi:hypothetical protein
MPFRTLRKNIEPGEPCQLYVAGPEDQEIEVRTGAFSDANMSVGFTFAIGGPDMAETGGLACFDSEWRSSVEEDDELWIQVFPAAWTSSTPVTVMIRSGKRSDRAVQQPAEAKKPARPVPAQRPKS